ncbi:MAG: photosynthetic complex assembly protein PuhC [Aliihoeflea sp.]|jgi:putative photosynthetic complex assembly protein
MARATWKPDPLKKPALACGSLVAMAIVFAAFGPKAELPRAIENSPVAESISLRFTDTDDGSVIAVDAGSGEVVASLGVGEGGFVRQAMRGLARDRMLRSISDEPPFLLSRLADGKLVLSDPETGRVIALDSFGRSNAASFAAFLDHGREPK